MLNANPSRARASRRAVPTARTLPLVLLALAPFLPGAWGIPGFAPAPLSAQESSEGERALPLVVDAAWLQENLGAEDLVVLHVARGADPTGPTIPGALPLNLDDLAVTSQEEGQPVIMLDIPTDLTPVREAFEALGVSDDSRVVVVFDGTATPSATRALWTLQVLGLGDRSALLDGGLEAWIAEGGELGSLAVEPASPGKIDASPRWDVYADRDFVLEYGEAPGIALIDARRVVSYDGTRPEREGRAGHIPGAGSAPYPTFYTDDGRLRDSAEIRRILSEAGYQEGDQVVAYCHIGYWASAVVFAARSVGIEAILYDGSMTEWSQDFTLPLVLPPER